jgi:hypothetical protein
MKLTYIYHDRPRDIYIAHDGTEMKYYDAVRYEKRLRLLLGSGSIRVKVSNAT